MEETYNTRALILNRYDFRENDSRIICYSEDRGKLELVARGAKKLSSKSSGHLEPLTLSRLMVVVGKDLDYAGTATGENFYPEIKNDLAKLTIAGQALALVEKMTREGEVGGHQEIFNLLKDFLEELNSPPYEGGVAGGLDKRVIPAQAGIQNPSTVDFKLDSAGVYPRAGGDGNDEGINVFSQKLSSILGFSPEDFEELIRRSAMKRSDL